MNRRKHSPSRTGWPLSLTLSAFGALASLATGCSQDQLLLPEGVAPPVASVRQAVSVGDVTINTAGMVVNNYIRLIADAPKGATSLSVDGEVLAFLNVNPGDYIMVIQMQGAAISTANAATYGTLTNLGGAGLYEQVLVRSVNQATSTITIDAGCGGLRNAYSVAGHTQVIKVAEYGALTVESGASITAQPWDGSVGGVVAVRADSITVRGSIDANGAGFRGGNGGNRGGYGMAGDQTAYVGTTTGGSPVGAEKGEGIAGSSTDYDTMGGRGGRGAPANGGGGGNSLRAGGGGGAHAGNAALWSGQGVMNAGVVGATAWSLDPDYIAIGKLTTSPGGGRGGYTQSLVQQDATKVAPGQPPGAATSATRAAASAVTRSTPTTRAACSWAAAAAPATRTSAASAPAAGARAAAVAGRAAASSTWSPAASTARAWRSSPPSPPTAATDRMCRRR